MVRSPRNGIARLERRRSVAHRYLHGETQWQIANNLEISQGTVSKDLTAIRREWLASAVRDFDQHKSEQLAKLDAAEREFWNGWERSKLPDSDGKQRDGNPRFLQGVLDCVTKRCELLGILERAGMGAAPVVTVLSGIDLAAVCGDSRPPEQLPYHDIDAAAADED